MASCRIMADILLQLLARVQSCKGVFRSGTYSTSGTISLLCRRDIEVSCIQRHCQYNVQIKKKQLWQPARVADPVTNSSGSLDEGSVCIVLEQQKRHCQTANKKLSEQGN